MRTEEKQNPEKRKEPAWKAWAMGFVALLGIVYVGIAILIKGLDHDDGGDRGTNVTLGDDDSNGTRSGGSANGAHVEGWSWGNPLVDVAVEGMSTNAIPHCKNLPDDMAFSGYALESITENAKLRTNLVWKILHFLTPSKNRGVEEDAPFEILGQNTIGIFTSLNVSVGETHFYGAGNQAGMKKFFLGGLEFEIHTGHSPDSRVAVATDFGTNNVPAGYLIRWTDAFYKGDPNIPVTGEIEFVEAEPDTVIFRMGDGWDHPALSNLQVGVMMDGFGWSTPLAAGANREIRLFRLGSVKEAMAPVPGHYLTRFEAWYYRCFNLFPEGIPPGILIEAGLNPRAPETWYDVIPPEVADHMRMNNITFSNLLVRQLINPFDWTPGPYDVPTFTPEEYPGHPYLTPGAGKQIFHISQDDPLPEGTMAVLKVGNLLLRLSETSTKSWTIYLPRETWADFSVRGARNPKLRLSAGPSLPTSHPFELDGPKSAPKNFLSMFQPLAAPAGAADATVILLDDPGGIFQKHFLAPAFGRINFATPSLVEDAPCVGSCVCGECSGFYKVMLKTSAYSAATDITLDVEWGGGGNIQTLPNNHARVCRPARLPEGTELTATLAAPVVAWGKTTLSVKLHACLCRDAEYCEACAFFHLPRPEPCATNLPGSFNNPQKLPVNSGDADLNAVEDRRQTPPPPNSLLHVCDPNLPRQDLCCCPSLLHQCPLSSTNFAYAVVTFRSPEIRAWSVALQNNATNLAPIAVGDKVFGPFHFDATAASATLGSSKISYDVYNGNGSNLCSVTRHYTFGNVQIFGDYNLDNAITPADVKLIPEDFPGAEWFIHARPQPYLLRIQNETPSDCEVLLRLSNTQNIALKTNATLGAAVPLDLHPDGSATLPLARDTSTNFWLDASVGDASFKLKSAILGPDGTPVFTSREQTITVIDKHFPSQTIRPDPNGTVTYKLSPNAKNVGWWVDGPQFAGGGLALPMTFNADLALGDYVVYAHYHDLWNPGGTPANFNPIYSNILHVVDVRLFTHTHAKTISTNRFEVPLAMTYSSGPAVWTITPNLPNGARLFANQTGGTGVFSLDNPETIWLSTGTVLTNYTLTVHYPGHTNINETAEVQIIIPEISFVKESGTVLNSLKVGKWNDGAINAFTLEWTVKHNFIDFDPDRYMVK